MLKHSDIAISNIITKELYRQQMKIEMIASENFTSLAVMEANGSILTNKYAEGYAGKRYYGGCEFVDEIETIAKERLCRLFDCKYANVQPHSGSQANQAVFLACLTPGDVILAMSLDSGGHLTHGSKVNLSGKWFNAIGYGTDEQGFIDYDQIAQLAAAHQPKLIIAGGSAYPRTIDFAKFREIADSVGAILMVDMAHFAGLVAGGVFPNPLPHAHVVTSTTHKTLRGPRGGIILSNDEAMMKKIDSAVFPGLQGGPLMHTIAAKAVAFGEALEPDFQHYAANVVRNAKALAKTLQDLGHTMVSGGTDCHLLLVNLDGKGITGQEAEHALERAGITCNKNSIKNDPLPPRKTSGIRLGSPAATTRGLQEEDFVQLGRLIDQVLRAQHGPDAAAVEAHVHLEIEKICHKYPLYSQLTEGQL